MSTAAVPFDTRSRVAGTSTPGAGIVQSPSHLTDAQLRELESELRRELGALERRLASERQADAGESHGVADPALAAPRATDTDVRRDAVAAALARLATGAYGACAHCGEPIPFGRLLVMPEAAHCVGCGGRA